MLLSLLHPIIVLPVPSDCAIVITNQWAAVSSPRSSLHGTRRNSSWHGTKRDNGTTWPIKILLPTQLPYFDSVSKSIESRLLLH